MSKSTITPNRPKRFKFAMNESVKFKSSGVGGIISGRAEYEHNEDSYLVRHADAAGQETRDWYPESKLA